jgi:uncharacterized protein (DUF1919 family)
MHKRRLRNPGFTIISDDCWGAEVYRHLGIPYNTPFVGGFLHAPCYLQLLTDLRGYLEGPVEFRKESARYPEVNEQRARGEAPAYPIAVLGDEVEIHYNHYGEREARERFERRVTRIDYDNLFVKAASGHNLWTEELLEQFDATPYPRKLCLTDQDLPRVRCAARIRWYSTNGTSLFSICLAQFDVIGWLNGDVQPGRREAAGAAASSRRAA